MLSFSAFHSHAVVLLVSFLQKSGFIFEVAKMSSMHVSFGFASKSLFKTIVIYGRTVRGELIMII